MSVSPAPGAKRARARVGAAARRQQRDDDPGRDDDRHQEGEWRWPSAHRPVTVPHSRAVRVLRDLPTGPLALDDDLLVQGDNLAVLPPLPDGAFDMVYIDPPFNTGRAQARRDAARGRGPGRRPHGLRRAALPDRAGDGPHGLRGRLRRLPGLPGAAPGRGPPAAGRPRDALRPPRSARGHYVKVLLDELFGRACFLNELIWAYDYGAQAAARAGRPSTTRSSSTSRTPTRYWFDDAEVDREPYMAPGLVTRRAARRAASGRPTSGGTRSCRPTAARRPGIRRRSHWASCGACVAASSRPGGWCLDFFAGSGTLGAAARPRAALRAGRRVPDAIDVASASGPTPASTTPAAR